MSANGEPSEKSDSPARTGFIIALTLMGFPLVWPVHVARGVLHGRRHRARMARATNDEAATVARILAGEATSALRSTRTTSSMASGPEEETCIEIAFPSERVVVRASTAVGEALRDRGVKTRDEESLASGMGTLFAWAMWGVAMVALASFITSPSFLMIAGVIAVAGVLALVLT